MANPEFKIVERTTKLIQSLAAAGRFTASGGERVRRVLPIAVKTWRVTDGSQDNQSPSAGVVNTILPAIFITSVPVETRIGSGVNCADDEVVQVAVQILDSAPHSNTGASRTYTDWMSLIRAQLLTVPNPFLQDATPTEYDPYVVHVVRRVSAEAQSLVRNRQTVALMIFQVVVRHHR